MASMHWMVELGLGAMQLAGKIVPAKKILFWDRHLPRPIRGKSVGHQGRSSGLNHSISDHSGDASGELKVVYFPSCINQSMGTSVRDPVNMPLMQVTVEVLQQAGYQVIYPEGMRSLCCGTPWESKGFRELADSMSDNLEQALLKASDGGKFPVLCDTSPCIYRMKRVFSKKLSLYEPVEFIHDFLLDKLALKRSGKQVAFHVTCSSTRMELKDKFERVARACTDHPLFPEEVGCCGFAGDKGFTDPSLNQWALRNLRQETLGADAGYSNSRTCEIGLSRNSGIDYRSIMYLVYDAMRGS
jgi:D-lactate dehydrogenase